MLWSFGRGLTLGRPDCFNSSSSTTSSARTKLQLSVWLPAVRVLTAAPAAFWRSYFAFRRKWWTELPRADTPLTSNRFASISTKSSDRRPSDRRQPMTLAATLVSRKKPVIDARTWLPASGLTRCTLCITPRLITISRFGIGSMKRPPV